jgi:hypothetical protein
LILLRDKQSFLQNIGKFSPLGNPKKKSTGNYHTKDFGEKNVPKSPDFEDSLFKITIFRQY